MSVYSLFLKEFQSKFDKTAVLREIEVCKAIGKTGIQTSEFINGQNGEYVFCHKEHCLYLQKFIDGITFSQNNVPDKILFESAEMLGRIHLALKDMEFLPSGFDENWFTDWSAEMSIKKHKKIMENIPNLQISEKEKSEITDACKAKIGLLKNYSEDHLKYNQLTRVNSHGDYNNLQLLCDKHAEKIKAVVDFSSAEYLPAVWEIIRSYTYGSNECSSGASIDLQKLKKYVDYYLKFGSLSMFDVSNMAGFYYFNLLRSTFGLNSENPELIKFGLWRTEMCKYLSINYREIDLFLLKEYKNILK